MLLIIIAAKVGIKSYRFGRESLFICVSMDVTTQLELCFLNRHELPRMSYYTIKSKQTRKFKKEVGIAIKRKQVASQLSSLEIASYPLYRQHWLLKFKT